ncbi:MAG: diguanylate cyclase [Nitrospirae bacterium]|nr:MAG: diguanylate cyclase [Nitrospirota bacterium]
MQVLIAEDDPISRLALDTKLTQWGYQVVGCADGEEAVRALQGPSAPELAILDWDMPGLSGPDVCREVRKRQQEPYLYLIILTAKDEKEDLIAALEAGADEYLRKPFDPQELKARLRTGQRILNLQRELIASRETLRVQASHDALTGLWNRGAIQRILEQEFDRAQRTEAPLGLVLGDLDLFKQVNDTYGHLAGDTVLRQVAAALQQSMRGYDAVGRYGGEEFLVLLPGCDLSNARLAAERLRACIEDLPIVIEARPGRSQTIRVTMSLGLAVSAPSHRPADSDALIYEADSALYRLKGTDRRNRVELFLPELTDSPLANQ